jgi:hypothetical protein
VTGGHTAGAEQPEHQAPSAHDEELLDEALEESFPASDPPAGPATVSPSPRR